MFQRIEHNGNLLAIIIPATFSEPGVRFFTPSAFSQQLAFMKHAAGHRIDAHVHNPVVREVVFTQEVLILRRGTLRVDFYENNGDYLQSHVLGAGDVILLAGGGHGFEVLEDVEMIEIKQGPYAGDSDKTRFPSVSADRVVLARD